MDNMEKNALKQLDEEGKIEVVKPPEPVIPVEHKTSDKDKEIDPYLAVLRGIIQNRRHLTVAPTLVPKNILEQIQFFDDGVNRRLYLYVNNTWRYVALT